LKYKQDRSVQSQTGFMLDIGAIPLPDGSTRFRVWGPRTQKIEVIMPDSGRAPVALAAERKGYFSGIVAGVGDGDRYRFLLDDTLERPDPASCFQPEGAHGPSQVVDHNRFQWNDKEWEGIPLEQ
jgi:maltooligosyltrehalose trehalohydrolase